MMTCPIHPLHHPKSRSIAKGKRSPNPSHTIRHMPLSAMTPSVLSIDKACQGTLTCPSTPLHQLAKEPPWPLTMRMPSSLLNSLRSSTPNKNATSQSHPHHHPSNTFHHPLLRLCKRLPHLSHSPSASMPKGYTLLCCQV